MEPQTILAPACLSGPGHDPLLHRLLEWLPRIIQPCYLVGGAVRDAVLRSRPGERTLWTDQDCAVRPPPARAYDLDLLVPEGGVRVARQMADQLGAAFYALDPVRDVGRAIFGTQAGQDQRIVDVAAFQGATLLDDLCGRDFSINAMAIDITRQPLTVIDPTGGLADLRAGRLRAASPQALRRDAVRTLRAVRLRAQFGFQIEPDTVSLIQTAAADLSGVSAERVRDELVKVFGLPDTAASLRTLDALHLLSVVLPELLPLKGLPQPHRDVDGFEHTLQVVSALERLLPLAVGLPPSDVPFPDRLSQHLAVALTGGQSRRLLLTLAAVLHDIGKPPTCTRSADGAIHYYNHDVIGAEMAGAVLARLRFSRPAIAWVTTVVRQHLRPLLLAREPVLSRRAMHRFFRDAGDAGVDVVLLALADHPPAALPGPRDDAGDALWTDSPDSTGTSQDFALQTTVGRLLEAYFDQRAEIIAPPVLLSGGDIIKRFGLSPGPQIGELQRDLQEAQAAGEIATHAEAKEWVRVRLQSAG